MNVAIVAASGVARSAAIDSAEASEHDELMTREDLTKSWDTKCR